MSRWNNFKNMLNLFQRKIIKYFLEKEFFMVINRKTMLLVIILSSSACMHASEKKGEIILDSAAEEKTTAKFLAEIIAEREAEKAEMLKFKNEKKAEKEKRMLEDLSLGLREEFQSRLAQTIRDEGSSKESLVNAIDNLVSLNERIKSVFEKSNS